MEEKTFNQIFINHSFNQKQVLAFFGRLVTTGCFKTEREYELGKKFLKSHLNLDYDNFEYSEYKDELDEIIYKEQSI